ncbi:DUF5819 family protein [Streptomyces stelliscabiei]|uniref:Uncharacterized protein n=1 Tax=Streptomyces stelliscabiei TaxID=146820 RepID=A0A8I0P9H0_9ACTN|nr:DUF5819 family protein [Streptomyces stelliscabiei]KND44080.1 membrane protein [Streptomyces stelliscabiei]MBE1598589.1 hypothetical protein [Streptomyces stelliscabiei]MDX2516618.1 DUF5819 family protein [Streptomyces stelliscabiei]MDX2553507.1 DUF5819 family protein [Streptomyces stelliscabiei]MDX2613517.1 DUF5819 family protein [Streptomyces stelliscabiei]
MDANDEVSNARRGPDEPEGSDSASEADPQVRPSRQTPDPASSPAPDPASPSAADPTDPALLSAPDAASPSAPDPASPSTADPGAASTPVTAPDPSPGPAASGMAALTLPYQIAVALVLAVVAVVTCVHLGLVFLHIAPSNTLTKQHGRAVDEWVYPEFEQNWKLFAPNPLQQNIAVQARAEVRTADGETRETGWYDLSALDGAAIDRNPVPSHTQQNELRRAWDFYVATHDNDHRATTSRGDLSERYVRRIVVMRLDRERAGEPGGVIERIQLRSRTTNVPAPEWSEEKVSDKPVVRELPWWQVTDDDRTDAAANAGGVGRATTGRTEASAE